jgi:hypothetical protein
MTDPAICCEGVCPLEDSLVKAVESSSWVDLSYTCLVSEYSNEGYCHHEVIAGGSGQMDKVEEGRKSKGVFL